MVRCTTPKLTRTTFDLATIRARKLADGTVSYTAQIRIKRDGVQVYQESQTFARKQAARELYRAQGFPDNYVIDQGHDGARFSKKDQVLMVGNSVSPWPMMALINANADRNEDALLEVAA